jgi:hypothetical protein
MATVDVIANRSTASEILGKAYFETDTNSFIVYNGIGWVELQSDGTGSAAPYSEYSLSFDGSNDFLKTTSSPEALFSSDYTVSIWYKRNETVAGGKWIFGSDYRGNGKNIIKLYELNGYLTYNAQAQSASATVSFAHAADTDWHHYAISATQSGNSVIYKAYLDGVYKNTATATQTLSNYDNPYSIGIGAGYSGNAFSHASVNVDDFAIFESALSDGGVSTGQTAQGNIAALYNGGVPAVLPVSAGLHYRMGDDSNDSPVDGENVTGIQDSSGNGNHATQSTATNQPTFSTEVPA